MIGGADQAFLFHALDQGRGAVVSDTEPALNIAGRDLTVLEYDSHRLIVKLVAGLAIALAALLIVARLLLGHGLEVIRDALLLQMPDDFLDFLVGDKGTVHAHDAPAA